MTERMIQKLEEMIRRFCAYDLEFKESDGFTHDWCTLIPDLELAYKTSIHSPTGKTTAMLEIGGNPRLPYDTIKEYLVDIHPTESSFKKSLTIQDIMQIDVYNILLIMKKKDGIKVINHLDLQ
ncbi:hypothetical protein O181_101274 [Austropuccinia psidii MF-1]|uniref:Uncharacterized protein n=1 Tax=Austropuccinia psidii MF-1 TaxID=1389203 RepID=A0A9Q3PH61_9BASI|nr:hypothetical protein [Austropuccinia psidii MF-1]